MFFGMFSIETMSDTVLSLTDSLFFSAFLFSVFLLFVLYELEIHNQLTLSDLWILGFTIPILPRLTLPTAIHSGLVFVKPRF